MSTHVPADATARQLLDDEAIAKALSRIAHEIIERTRRARERRARRDPVARRTARVAPSPARRGAERRRRFLSARSTSPSTATTSTSATAAVRRTPAGRARDEHRVSDRGDDGRPRRRRALHGPDDPRRDRRAARVRAPGASAARSAGRSRSPRAADPPRLRRQEPSDGTRRAHPGRAGGDRRARRRLPRRGARGRRPCLSSVRPQRPRRHLLSIGDLTRDDVERILETAQSLAASLDREMKKLPTLRGRTVVNLFYESSTRTLASFELAAKRLSADTMSIRSAGSSVDKGESLKDTALTLAAYEPDVIVVRHPSIGAPAARRASHRRARRERRRRQASAPDPGAARPVRDARGSRAARGGPRRDRRRRPPLARRALARPGARARRRRDRPRRPADARAARNRGARLQRLARRSARSRTPTSSTSSGCSASAWRRRSSRRSASTPRCTGSRRSASGPGRS